jgi:geranylgeranyl diphosphate synthase, type II
MEMVHMEMKSLSDLQQLIQKKIDGYCRVNGDTALFEPINYLIQLPGKRMRPAICLMSANLFTNELDSIVYPAFALEVFHNFTLMHDDIMDQSPLRRGMPTVHERWNTNTAILSGDAMMIQAYQLLIKTDTAHLPALLPLFSKTALEVCQGQQLDMDFEKMPVVTAQEYIEMIRLKTSVLIACAMQMGGLLTGQDQSVQEQLYQIGLYLGLSFQLQDDYLDTFGTSEKVGKRIGNDILAHKKTYMMLRLHESMAQSNPHAVHDLYHQDLPEDELIRTVQSWYIEQGIDQEAKQLIQSYYDKAIQLFDEIGVPSERKNNLRALMHQLHHRES